MFDGASNVQLVGELLKDHYPNISVMREVEHVISSKNEALHQMITDHKKVYNLFGPIIYHRPHSIFKSKYYGFHNRNIGLFSGNVTRMDGYFVGIHRYINVIKSTYFHCLFCRIQHYVPQLKTVLSSIIHQDNKSWEKIYIISNFIFPDLCVPRLVDSNKARIDKAFYYYIITKISIIKSLFVIFNKDLSLVSISSSQKVWS